jgi:hypothetical protein
VGRWFESNHRYCEFTNEYVDETYTGSCFPSVIFQVKKA